MYRIELELSNRGSITLEQFRFFGLGDSSPRVTTRSGSPLAREVVDENLFYWIRNRKALVQLLLKVACDGSETARLKGGAGSAAALLTDSLSADASWLLDLFGVSSSGKMLSSALFRWRKEDPSLTGRYEVSVRADCITQEQVHVYLNGGRVSLGTVRSLLDTLSAEFDDLSATDSQGGQGNALVAVTYKHYSVRLALDPDRHRAEYVNECRLYNSGDEPLRFIHWNLGGTERSQYQAFVVTTARGARLRTAMVEDFGNRQRYLIHLPRALAPGEESTIVVRVVQPNFNELEGSLFHESCAEPCSVDLEVTCPPRYEFDRYAVFAEKKGEFAIKNLPKPRVSRDPVGGRVVRVSLKSGASAPLYRLLWSCSPVDAQHLPGVFAKSLAVSSRQSG